MSCDLRRWIVLLLIGGLASAGCQQSSSTAEDRSARANASASVPPNVGLRDGNGTLSVKVAGSPVADSPKSAAPAVENPNVDGNPPPAGSGVNGNAAQGVRPRLAVRSSGVRDITFDDLEFKIAKDASFERSMLPDSIEELHGKQALIRGFILPSYQEKGIKQFILVRDNQQCCFGPGAYLYHNIQVEMQEGRTASFSIRPVTVEGVFSIKPWIGPDKKCYSVYHILAENVR